MSLKISIITVAFNSGATILKTIESVNMQDYENYEHIFIDGSSHDNTCALIKKFSKKHVLISEKDDGLYDAMNKGLENANGDIICFLNSDDFYADSDVLSKVAKKFEKNNAQVVISNIGYVDKNSKITRIYKGIGFKKWQCKFGFVPPHLGTFLSREAVKSTGKFSLNYPIASDFDYLLRVFCRTPEAKVIELNKITLFMTEGGVSTKNLNSNWIISKDIYRSLKENNIYASMCLILLRLPIKYFNLFSIK